jgi:hypothetical protein
VIVAVPGEAPPTIPVKTSAVAIAVLLLLHAPPVVPLASGIVRPVHTFITPVAGSGSAFTVTRTDAAQLPIVYEIVAVPADDPITIPPPLTLAMPVFPLLHTPPVVTSFRLTEAPVHISGTPVIEAGERLTVTTAVTVHPLPKE